MFKKMHIDIRNEVDLLQNELSYDILYNRATKFIKCRCFDPMYQSGNPRCNICNGSGHLTSLERMEVIEYSYKAAPRRKDLIMVTGWNRDKTPTNLHHVYEIKDVDPVRGDGGRVEYYRVLATQVPDLRRQLQDAINRIPAEGRRLIAGGKRYVWPIKKA